MRKLLWQIGISNMAEEGIKNEATGEPNPSLPFTEIQLGTFVTNASLLEPGYFSSLLLNCLVVSCNSYLAQLTRTPTNTRS